MSDENLELVDAEVDAELLSMGGLPKEYWPCPLCIMTLLQAYTQATIHNETAFAALRVSGLVEDWDEGRVTTTERGRMFVEMLLETPLPEQRWVDPRVKGPQ